MNIKLEAIVMQEGIDIFFKVFDREEFIGYVTKRAEDKWLFNPHYGSTMKSAVFDSWAGMMEYFDYAHNC